MSSEQEGLLKAIDEAPEDDAPRLVYADWLDDHGDPDRAEFVRCQVRLARMAEWDPDRFDLEERSLDLFAEHRAAWLARLPKWAKEMRLSFRRGLPEEARLSPAAFLRHGERLAQLIPLRGLTLVGWERLDEVGRLRATAGLTDLTMLGGSTSPEAHRALFGGLDAPRLRRLCAWRAVMMGGDPEALAEWPGLARLTGLAVQGSPDVAALLSSPHLGRLERLVLESSKLGQAGVRLLARSEKLAGLRELDLNRNPGLGVGELAAAEWPALESACFPFGRLGAGEVRALLSARWAAGLRSLEARWELGEEGGRLLQGYRAERLARLALSNGNLGGGGAMAALAEADCLAGVTSLALENCGIGAAGAEALARSRKLGRLARLDLRANPLTSAAVRALVESDRLGSLCELVCSSPTDGDAAVGLAGSPALARFRALAPGALLGQQRGLEALARSPHLARLRRLDLGGNGLGDEGLAALLGAAWLPGLRELRLRGNVIGDRGAAALAGCAGLARLRLLELGYNRVGDAGAAALAESPHLGRLLFLGLKGQRIGAAARDRLRERFGPAVEFS
jgi:uncharacterized protein (TIGR02996 family)